jgi:hypothetical protein
MRIHTHTHAHTHVNLCLDNAASQHSRDVVAPIKRLTRRVAYRSNVHWLKRGISLFEEGEIPARCKQPCLLKQRRPGINRGRVNHAGGGWAVSDVFERVPIDICARARVKFGQDS